MFFAQLRSILKSLRFRLMMWNAVVMLVASLGVLWGLREGVRYTLLSELDSDLQADFNEISLALVSVFEADSPFLHAGMDRKARGHKQRSWFLQLVDVRTPEQREADRLRDEERRREEQQRREERGRGRSRGRPTPSVNAGEAPASARSESTTPLPTSDKNQSAETPRPPAPPSIDESQSGVAKSSEPPTASAGGRSNGARVQPRLSNNGSPGKPEEPASGPRIIWQTFNVPDWSMLTVPPDFHQFILPDGVATTVDHYRVLEQTVSNARGGPVRVRIGASMRSIQHASETTDRLMYFNVLAALIIAPLGGYWLALRATKPLHEMIRTTERLRPQQMEERLPISKTDDEIDQLSGAFNRLLDRIAEYLNKRQDLLANSAHELRTPLAALRSMAEVALANDRSAEEYRELLDSIVNECGNLELLVNQLLLLSETESAHFEARGETVDLSRITGEACDMFGAVAESRGVTLKTEIAEGVLVDGSRLHLRQLLNNLIDNAIKFIPGEGEVAVRLQPSPQGPCLSVADTGIGIAEEEQQRLFERFYRGDRARRRNTPTRGTGLGLSICRAIAEAHGGSITIASQPGVGTQVSVQLPQPAASHQLSRPFSTASTVASSSGLATGGR